MINSEVSCLYSGADPSTCFLVTVDKSLKVAGPVLSHTMGWSSQSWCLEEHTGMSCDSNCDDGGVKGADGGGNNDDGGGGGGGGGGADGNGNN